MRYLKATRRHLRLTWHTILGLRSWSLLSKVVLAGYTIFVILNILFGYAALGFTIRHGRFYFSKTLAVYIAIMGTLFTSFYVDLMWKELRSGQIDSRDSIKIYSYMNACGVILYYGYQLSMSFSIIRLLNGLTLFADINYFDVTLKEMLHHFILVFSKSFGFPILMQVSLVLCQMRDCPEIDWLHTTRIMLPIIVGSLLNNCFFAFMVICNAIFKEINRILGVILSEVNRLQTPVEMSLHKPFYRMQRFCDLADRVEELAGKYAICNGYAVNFLKFARFSLITSLAINLLTTTLGCYVQYQALVDYLMLEKPFDVCLALARFVFLAIPYLEIVLISRISQQVLDEAKEAGNLLQRINLEHADERFQQEVDKFWLKVCTFNLKLMPMGLLELDGSLVNKMYSTLARFLLFFIQNDLSVRFSFK